MCSTELFSRPSDGPCPQVKFRMSFEASCQSGIWTWTHESVTRVDGCWFLGSAHISPTFSLKEKEKKNAASPHTDVLCCIFNDSITGETQSEHLAVVVYGAMVPF